MLKKALKISLFSSSLIGGVYYGLQREYGYDLAIYQSIYQLVQRLNPYYAVIMTKFFCYQNLLWRNELKDLKCNLLDMQLSNPLGIASGFDIDGSLITSLQNLGFGFIEIGSISPTPSSRNNDDINTYANENDSVSYQCEVPTSGLLKTKALLASMRKNNKITVPIGVNIMPSEDVVTFTPYAIKNDIENSVRELAPLADYLVLNLIGSKRIHKKYQELFAQDVNELNSIMSSIKKWQLEEIGLQACIQHEEYSTGDEKYLVNRHLNALPFFRKQENLITPFFIKLSSEQLQNLKPSIDLWVKQQQLNGIVLQKSQDESEDIYNNTLSILQQSLKIPIISVGNIKTGKDMTQRMNKGASACQIFSAFIIQGPNVIKQILE